MSDDLYANYDAQKEVRQRIATAARAAAQEDFFDAECLAAHHRMHLAKHSDAHYSLEPNDGRWRLNLYPGNCRIYADRNKPKRAPYLNLAGRNWTLCNVVSAAINLEARNA